MSEHRTEKETRERVEERLRRENVPATVAQRWAEESVRRVTDRINDRERGGDRRER